MALHDIGGRGLAKRGGRKKIIRNKLSFQAEQSLLNKFIR